MAPRFLVMCGSGALIAATAVLVLGAEKSGIESTTTVIHSFGGSSEAEYPYTDLVLDPAGNLYGMTVLGGDFGSGTVFRLSPPAGAVRGWTETVLHSFTSTADGGQPYGGVTLDGLGNIYGTAVVGGSGGSCVEDGCGVVWMLTNEGGSYTHSVIYDFTGGDDGYGPGGPVVLDDLGNLYGMTAVGGAYGLGVVYQLSPGEGDQWTLNVIHAFTGGEDGGAGSAGRLLVDPSGDIYGVATIGGTYGAGVVFQLTPAPSGPWTQTTLYSFQGQPDGSFPYGGLVRDASGTFYGTTYYGGKFGVGAVFALQPTRSGWSEKVLHSFRYYGTGGSYPIGHLVLDSAGVLYGTTSEGGAPGCSCGTIFSLTEVAPGDWHTRVVHRFTGVPDGSFAYNGLVIDPAGTLYGATAYGGNDDDGVVYRFRPLP